jgi:hypothetical protein
MCRFSTPNIHQQTYNLLLFSVFHPFLDMLLVEWLQHGCFATSPRAWPPHNYLDMRSHWHMCRFWTPPRSNMPRRSPMCERRTAHVQYR